jgi:plastocyanin
MRRFRTILIVVVAATTLAACSTAVYTAPATPSPEPSTTSSDVRAGGKIAVASIKDFTFTPDPIQVAVGGTATWTNNDSMTHTVTFDDTSVKSSGDLSQGSSFSATFPKAGTYTYHCALHPTMTGTVTVA